MSNRPLIHHDGIARPMTDDEFASYQLTVAGIEEHVAAIAAKEATKQSAIEKLAALGLTVDEIKEAFGLEAPQ